MKYFTILSLATIFLFSCTQNNAKKQEKPKDHSETIKKGKTIAKATFNALSSELKKAMSSGGVPAAAKYCNVAAMPITDSLSMKHHVAIKRTTNKLRNQNNKPTTLESQIFSQYEEKKAAGQKLGPIVKMIDGMDVFYAPILMKGLCLTCHGDAKTIPDYDVIKKLYPNDQATGYKEGDLRGMWSISFLDKKE